MEYSLVVSNTNLVGWERSETRHSVLINKELLGDSLSTGECSHIPVMSLVVNEFWETGVQYPVFSIYLLARGTTFKYLSTINTVSKG